MTDPTESFRRALLKNGVPTHESNKAQEKWDTDQVRELFEVHRFMAPFVMVTRKSDGVKGSLMFTHSPRWYFDFRPAEELEL